MRHYRFAWPSPQGYNTRALLITNPSNPLGTCYSHETLMAMLRWCLKRRMHLVR